MIFVFFDNQITVLPDDCYLYFNEKMYDRYFYRKDPTPVLLEDVPKEIKALCLIMGLPLS